MGKFDDTLNLRQTRFAMRGDLARREPEMLRDWEQSRLYERVGKHTANRPRWTLHDGPPYANGDLHMGHAVNKILKDMVVRNKTLAGFHAPYLPGWDCHGLPIEHQVEKAGGDRSDASAFRRRCRDFANSQIDLQRQGFIRMGVMGEWHNPYTTMHPATEAGIIRTLGRIHQQGLVQHRQKPVLWCSDCESALAEAEIEYRQRVSVAVDVAFPAADAAAVAAQFGCKGSAPAFAVIWTTTVWTLPANRAIVVHPDLDYVLVERDGKRYVVADELAAESLQRWQGEGGESGDVASGNKGGDAAGNIIGRAKGAELAGLVFRHPFYERDSALLTGEHITTEVGTGLVHTAPGHGEDDFRVGVQHGLPLDSPVNAQGRFVADLPQFGGQDIWQAVAPIANAIAQRGLLLAKRDYEHSYPTCWRHKSPVLFRTTWQWFVVMDQQKASGQTLRAEALQAIDKTDFYPSWGKNRLRAMIANRPDWCLSRQRVWNVPIPFFMAKDGSGLHPQTDAILQKVADSVAERGVEAWYESDNSQWLTAEDCARYERVTDALDVWFDSGTTHQAVMGWDGGDNATRPDMYLEGSDQHRGWFHSSLLTGVALHGIAPYRQILTHGFVVDGEGHKMSKSVGNVVSPKDIINQYGADILRLWVGASDYSGEIRVSDEIIKRVIEVYRRLRNTIRFLLANVSDYDPAAHAVPVGDLVEMDAYMLAATEALRQELAALYVRHEYHTIVHRLHYFCSVDLGGFYLDTIKDRLYVCPAESHARRSAQTVLQHIAETVLKLLAPILCFTADEAWRVLMRDDAASPLFATWTQPLPSPAEAEALVAKWQRLRDYRHEVLAALEAARNSGAVGSSLEAAVVLPQPADAALADALQSLQDELRYFLSVSAVAWGGAEVQVQKSPHGKCGRCWHHEASVSGEGVCQRCEGYLAGQGTRHFV